MHILFIQGQFGVFVHKLIHILHSLVYEKLFFTVVEIIVRIRELILRLIGGKAVPSGIQIKRTGLEKGNSCVLRDIFLYIGVHIHRSFRVGRFSSLCG